MQFCNSECNISEFMSEKSVKAAIKRIPTTYLPHTHDSMEFIPIDNGSPDSEELRLNQFQVERKISG